MRKMRAADQITTIAHAITPHSPSHGCHQGIPPGRACRSSISTGVNGGMKDKIVAKPPFGYCITGFSAKIGRMMGRIRRITSCCAS